MTARTADQIRFLMTITAMIESLKRVGLVTFKSAYMRTPPYSAHAA